MNKAESFFAVVIPVIDKTLDRLVPDVRTSPAELYEAIRWSLFAGGKRFRPTLAFAVGRAFGVPDEQIEWTAAAIEMIHTYSLIHDDLPSMDDDDLRRGRATCHKKFGEATAILAGDALQALAFQTIAEDEHLDAGIRTAVLSGLGSAASKMVAGQKLDLTAEGGRASIEDVREIHKNKTGALIEFSAWSAAVIGRASDADRSAVAEYGAKLGLLFQIVDDLLDITQSSESLGKTAGKDLTADKATYPSVYGIEKTRRIAESVCNEAKAVIAKTGCDITILAEIPDYLMFRTK
jgi:geranylgeranyl pyrophosphate synthase